MKNKSLTVPLELNKQLIIDEASKQIITSAENGRYNYFDYSESTIKMVAKKNIKDIEIVEAFSIVQALFPNYLVCSGLFNSFLLFEIKSGRRIDPPKYFYNFFGSYLNNDKVAKFNKLIDEIMDLFKKNNITCDNSWYEYYKKTQQPN